MKIKYSILAVVFTLFGAAHSFACSCVGPENAKDGFAFAKAVFSGQIISVSPKGNDFTFKVDRVWKGVSETEIIIRDYYAGTSCAFGLKVGEKYIFFATTHKEDDGKTILIGDVCNWTTKLNSKEAKDILKQIGAGKSLIEKLTIKKRPKTKALSKKRQAQQINGREQQQRRS